MDYALLLLLAVAVSPAFAARHLHQSSPFQRQCINETLPWKAALTHQFDLGTAEGSTLVFLHVWTDSSCKQSLGSLEIGLPDMQG